MLEEAEEEEDEDVRLQPTPPPAEDNMNDAAAAASLQPEQQASAAQVPTISKPLPKGDLDLIPDYDGNPIELISFLEVVETLLTGYCTSDIIEAPANHFRLLFQIKKRLHDMAKIVVINSTCKSVKEVITILKNNFADNRSVHQLTSELLTLKPNPKQHPLVFVNTLEEKRTTIICRHKLDGVHGEFLDFVTNQLDKQVINVLVEGLPYQLGAHLQTLRVKNLQDARQAIISESNAVLKHLNFSTDVSKMHYKSYNTHDKSHHNNNQSKFQNSQHVQANKQQSFPNQFRQNNQHQQFQSQQFKPQNFQNFQHRNPNQNVNNQNRFQQNQNRQNTDVSMRTVSNLRKSNSVHLTEPVETTEEVDNSKFQQLSDKVDKLAEAFHDFLGADNTQSNQR